MEQHSNSCTASEEARAKSIVRLYDAGNIDSMQWPETEDGDYARKFLLPFIKNGVSHFVENVKTELKVLAIDDLILPITINDAEYENCYVCSPYSQYVTYALEYISNIDSNVVKRPLLVLVSTLGRFLKAGKINKVVIVNNWILSTNLYPNVTSKQIAAITQFLEQQFPDHAILFRSVHTYGKDALHQKLKENRFALIASRQVYFLNTFNEAIFQSRLFKSDFKLLRECNNEVLDAEEIALDQAPRLVDLYRSIYLNRHSMLNPHLNQNFVRLALEQQILRFKALKQGNKIIAVAGYFHRNGMMTSPFLGYDVELSPENKLYRLTCTVLTQEAREKQLLFHLSSGASFFKKIRKADTAMEYHAVSNRHLPWIRRFPWMVLQAIANTIGISFMKRFES